MKNLGRTYRKLRDEQGSVLITVLIVATVFAILGYITLQVSIQSLDAADTHQHRISAQMVAEGGLETATARLRQGYSVDESLLPVYMDPSYALSTSDDILRAELLISGNTTARELDSFPRTTERTAYTFDSNVSTYNSDTDLIPGSSDDALYRYHDDFMFSEDYPGYEFSPLLSEGKLVAYSIGEVEDRTGEETLFKFLTAEYPADQYTYDVREAGVTEPSRMAPYPIIQTEHPYIGPSSKSWSITYQQDPRHQGRSLTGIRLMANPGEVQIDAGDTLLVSSWLVDKKRFQNTDLPPVIIPEHELGPYTNTTEVFTEELDTTTIGLFLYAADPPSPGMDYGFKIKGVRYGFDMDRFLAYYETPHPYDEIIPLTPPADLNIQVIYSPFQAEPLTTEFFNQEMRIQFSPEFSLDDGDTLFLFHAGDDAPVAPIVFYNSGNPIPSDYYSPAINRFGTNPDLPLGILLLLARTSGTDTDGVNNYGYKIAGLEYTDSYGAWVRDEDPIMESPHKNFLASNNINYTFPAFPPLPPVPPGNYVSYQTIYRPFCPNTDAVSGVGTIDNWSVEFSAAVDLSVTNDGAGNTDYIRIYTPGNIIRDIYDNVYYAALGSANDLLVQTPGNNWYNVDELKGAIIDCGIVEKMEIELFSDDFDGFDSTSSNYGLRIAEVGYTTSDGADDDDTPPTIRSDVNYPLNTGYPAFGNAPLQRTDWWYTYRDATLIGLHFDRYNFDIDPGDRIEIYDEFGILIATLLSDSSEGGPEIGDPVNPDEPGGQQQGGWDPIIGDPYGGGGVDPDTIVDLHATYGWVLIPGTTAQVRLVGDGDDNEGYSGFELDRVGYIEGTGGILSYVTDYQELAYGQYYDRTSEAMSAFRSLGLD